MGKYHNELDLENGNTSYAKLIAQISDGSTVLEFGPAEGVMTKYLAEEKGCRVYIVEIDEVAYQSAMQYSFRGVLGDIESFKWADEFSDVEFDHIVFSDVLEHLRNPQGVLTRARSLLKPQGTVLASIPNIAHNDIVLKLCENRFDYTDIGLLDNTHVHFFAYENLEPFFQGAGFEVIREDWVEQKTYHTEQATKSETPGRYIKDEFYTRPCGDIYQFIITAAPTGSNTVIEPDRSLPIREFVLSDAPGDDTNYPLTVQLLNEIVEQKENYINEQRGWISDRDREIMTLNGTIQQKDNYINEVHEKLGSAMGKWAPVNDPFIDYVAGFLSSMPVQFLLRSYSKARRHRHAD